MTDSTEIRMKHRFRGFLPVVIDIETGGFNAATDAMLEIAATFFTLTDEGHLEVAHSIARNVDPAGWVSSRQLVVTDSIHLLVIVFSSPSSV